jgi:hypothetical protein
MDRKRMSKEENLYESVIFPHVRYLRALGDHYDEYHYKEYVGEDETYLTKGKVYEFHYAMYSPNRETKYKEYLVTLSDIKEYIRYGDNDPNNWITTTKKDDGL